jgi:hypothetical protein
VSEIRPRLVAVFIRHLADEKGAAPGTVVCHVLRGVDGARGEQPGDVGATAGAGWYGSGGADHRGDSRILLAAERNDPDFLVYLWLTAEEGGRRGETLALLWTITTTKRKGPYRGGLPASGAHREPVETIVSE